MIQRAVKVRDGLKNWLSTDPEIRRMKLGSLQFSPNDWATMEKICSYLEKFESASRMMSGGNYPTLSYVMPVFIELFSFIEQQVQLASVEMKGRLTAAHEILAKYYSFTDDSPYYLIAVLLDPRFKKTYLERKGFETDYPGLIDETVTFLKRLVDEKQALIQGADGIVQADAMPSEDQSDFFHSMFSHCISHGMELNEVDKYLGMPCENPSVDPHGYWKAHSKEFPNLSAVAKDILSIPGSSVSVERIFNCGRDAIGLRRQALKPETFSALMFGKYSLK